MVQFIISEMLGFGKWPRCLESVEADGKKLLPFKLALY
jgi:hypothetical protein